MYIYTAYIASYSFNTHTQTHIIIIIANLAGAGFELVDAVGLVVLGHFAIDGQLKKEHYTERHHNMFVVEDKKELMDEIIELFSFTGHTVLDLITDLDPHSGSSLIYQSGYFTVDMASIVKFQRQLQFLL